MYLNYLKRLNFTTFFKLVILLIASNLIAQTVKAENLKFCYEPWEPFHYILEGKSTGIQIELMTKITASLGHTATFAELPYARCLKEVRLGNFDAILLTSGTKNNLIRATVSSAFWEIGAIVNMRWPKDQFDTLSDFDGKKVGLVTSYNYGDEIDAASEKWLVEQEDEALDNLRKTSAGRLDITITDIAWAQMMAKRHRLKLKFLAPALQSHPQFTFFNEDQSEYAYAISTEMQSLIDNGTVDRLYEKYTGQTFAEVRDRNEHPIF